MHRKGENKATGNLRCATREDTHTHTWRTCLSLSYAELSSEAQWQWIRTSVSGVWELQRCHVSLDFYYNQFAFIFSVTSALCGFIVRGLFGHEGVRVCVCMCDSSVIWDSRGNYVIARKKSFTLVSSMLKLMHQVVHMSDASLCSLRLPFLQHSAQLFFITRVPCSIILSGQTFKWRANYWQKITSD